MPQERMFYSSSSLQVEPSLTPSQFKMKRNPRKLAWTKSFRAAHGKEMTVDSTLSFAARRNVPVRYNRDLVATTLKAMQRVSEIRSKRERQFYKNRMRGNKERDLEADRKLVAENQHLLPPAEREAAQKLLEDESEMLDVVDELDEEEEEELEKQQLAQQKLKQKKKQRLVRGSGPEDMDVDA
jgi:large subunit ribosomal protein L24e